MLFLMHLVSWIIVVDTYTTYDFCGTCVCEGNEGGLVICDSALPDIGIIKDCIKIGNFTLVLKTDIDLYLEYKHYIDELFYQVVIYRHERKTSTTIGNLFARIKPSTLDALTIKSQNTQDRITIMDTQNDIDMVYKTSVNSIGIQTTTTKDRDGYLISSKKQTDAHQTLLLNINITTNAPQKGIKTDPIVKAQNTQFKSRITPHTTHTTMKPVYLMSMSSNWNVKESSVASTQKIKQDTLKTSLKTSVGYDMTTNSQTDTHQKHNFGTTLTSGDQRMKTSPVFKFLNIKTTHLGSTTVTPVSDKITITKANWNDKVSSVSTTQIIPQSIFDTQLQTKHHPQLLTHSTPGDFMDLKVLTTKHTLDTKITDEITSIQPSILTTYLETQTQSTSQSNSISLSFMTLFFIICIMCIVMVIYTRYLNRINTQNTQSSTIDDAIELEEIIHHNVRYQTTTL